MSAAYSAACNFTNQAERKTSKRKRSKSCGPPRAIELGQAKAASFGRLYAVPHLQTGSRKPETCLPLA
jgi:hypothetical protein